MTLWNLIVFVLLFMDATCHTCPAEDSRMRTTPSVHPQALASNVQLIIQEMSNLPHTDCDVLSVTELPDGNNFTAMIWFCCDFFAFPSTTELETSELETTE